MKQNRIKQVIALSMAAAMVFTTPAEASTVKKLAEKEQALKNEQAATKKSLAAKQEEIDELEDKKAELQKEIDKLDSDLVDIMVEIDTIKGDISDKETEIDTTKSDLEAAQAEEDKQYSDMKTRIQYIYENGGEAAWAETVLQEGDISDMLNKAEYTSELYDYDRTALETYVETVQSVTDLENSLEADKAELVEMKEASEEEQAELNKKLEEKKETSADYESEIKTAEKKAAEYTELIRTQSAKIREVQQEKQEAEAAAAAAAAAKKKAEEEAAKKAAEAAKSKETGTTTTTTDTKTSTDTKTETKTTTTTSTDTGGSTIKSGSGSAVASYACRFVGNPYVWGGTSLTNGCDCSGFVKSVYAHFGVSLPHSSSALRKKGKGVSYSQAKAGDLICYSGHVAIYIGGGRIVHASNKKEGIKISNNAAYRTIVAVRRILG